MKPLFTTLAIFLVSFASFSLAEPDRRLPLVKEGRNKKVCIEEESQISSLEESGELEEIGSLENDTEEAKPVKKIFNTRNASTLKTEKLFGDVAVLKVTDFDDIKNRSGAGKAKGRVVKAPLQKSLRVENHAPSKSAQRPQLKRVDATKLAPKRVIQQAKRQVVAPKKTKEITGKPPRVVAKQVKRVVKEPQYDDDSSEVESVDTKRKILKQTEVVETLDSENNDSRLPIIVSSSGTNRYSYLSAVNDAFDAKGEVFFGGDVASFFDMLEKEQHDQEFTLDDSFSAEQYDFSPDWIVNKDLGGQSRPDHSGEWSFAPEEPEESEEIEVIDKDLKAESDSDTDVGISELAKNIIVNASDEITKAEGFDAFFRGDSDDSSEPLIDVSEVQALPTRPAKRRPNDQYKKAPEVKSQISEDDSDSNDFSENFFSKFVNYVPTHVEPKKARPSSKSVKKPTPKKTIQKKSEKVVPAPAPKVLPNANPSSSPKLKVPSVEKKVELFLEENDEKLSEDDSDLD